MRAIPYTHGQATRTVGTVCGADEGPATRVTDDPHRVTCPECIGYADIEVLPDDAVCGDPHLIEALREAARGHFRKIDGVVVDMTTAAAILAVYDAANPATRAKLTSMRLDRLVEVSWRILRPHL